MLCTYEKNKKRNGFVLFFFFFFNDDICCFKTAVKKTTIKDRTISFSDSRLESIS